MKRGFTLIELLAVIVILTIIALIAIPIILNIIKDTKEKAFKESINGIIDDAILESALKMNGEELLYKYENNNWVESKLNIDGVIPKYVEIKVNKDGKVRYAITDGEYCALKEYDNEINIKRISSENNDKKVEEQYCKLDAAIPTDASCFNFDKSKGTIMNYKCGTTITDVVIPEEIEGIKVTSIGYEAFKSKGLTSVVIPNSVTSIGGFAFQHNKLTNITIPDTVTELYSAAFTDNKLSGEDAFIYYRNSDGSVNYSSLNSYGGAKIENVIIPKEKNGVILKKIGWYAFEYTNLKSVIIPEGVEVIGNGAFGHNRLKSVIIPNSVTEIAISAFTHNYEIENLTIGNSVKSIGGSAFSYNNLTNVIIPNSVTNIGSSAFSNNYLTNITIPDSVISIGQSAFTNNRLSEEDAFIYNRKNDGSIDYTSLNSYGGKKTENVIIPEGIISIGPLAFCNTRLKSVVIPNSVNIIKQQAFENNNLTSITIPESVTIIESLVFSRNYLTDVTIKGKTSTSDFTSYGSNVFGWSNECSDLTCITWE